MAHLFLVTNSEISEDDLIIDRPVFQAMKCNIIFYDFVIEAFSIVVQSILFFNLDFSSWAGFIFSVLTTLIDFFVSSTELLEINKLYEFSAIGTLHEQLSDVLQDHDKIYDRIDEW